MERVESTRTNLAVGRASGRRDRRRRRSFVVHRGYQLRVAALATAIALVLLVFLNLSIYSSGVESTRRMIDIAPELEAYAKAQDRTTVALVILGSIVFLVGVFLVSILETHKTAGACVAVSKRCEEVASGRYDVRLQLRSEDHLRELEPVFNRMCSSLQRSAWSDADRLEELAERSDLPKEVERSLRELADALRRRGG